MGRRKLHPHCRSQEGHHHQRRRKHLVHRSRARHRRPPGGARMRRGFGARRAMGRSARGLYRDQAGRESGGTGALRIPPRPAGEVQASPPFPLHGHGAAQNRHGQNRQAPTARNFLAGQGYSNTRITNAMWQQNYTPIAGSLALSALIAAIPIFTLLLLLGVLRKPAWLASLAGLAAAAAVALGAYGMPAGAAI